LIAKPGERKEQEHCIAPIGITDPIACMYRILLKLGTYGFFRFNIPMFPAASADEAYFGRLGCVV